MKVSIIKSLALAGSLACIAAFQAIPAAAQDNSFQDHKLAQLSEQSQQGAKTRSQVRSEYLQAVKDGTIPVYHPDSGVGSFARAASSPSTKTRAEVRSEYLQAVKDRTIPVYYPDSGVGSFTLTASSEAAALSSLTRQAVIADTIEWMRLHRGDVQMGGQ